MIAIEKLQVLTFLMGVIVVLVSILAYSNTSMGASWHRLIDLLTNGLTFFFIAYAIAVNAETTGSRTRFTGFGTRGMYTAFLVLTCLVSWALWIFNGSFQTSDGDAFLDSMPGNVSGDSGWKRVSTQVARPLALGSLFVLPYIYSSF